MDLPFESMKFLFNVVFGFTIGFNVINTGSIMGILEAASHLANIAMAVAICYSAFPLHAWLKQYIASRRADVAKDILEGLEYFYLRLEQLVSWQYLLAWDEWGKTFNDILRSHFLIAKLKAQRLQNTDITKQLEIMQQCAQKLPGNQRLTTQHTPQGQLWWKDEASKGQTDFEAAWRQFCEEWAALKRLLIVEALYDMPRKQKVSPHKLP